MSNIQNLLIVSHSGRMLAQLAKNAGFRTIVIDCFADSDTQTLAQACIKVETLAIEHLSIAIHKLKLKYTLTHAVYGSGFENYQDSLDFLHKNLTILGNTMAVFTAIQNKPLFFSTLKQFNIPYPETVFQAPESLDNWLVKPMQGEGGFGIKKYESLSERFDSCYWQKNIEGLSMSAIFIAEGTQYSICGFHKQLDSDSGFIFSGLISQPRLCPKIRHLVSDWIASLVLKFGLKGLNSIDFILKDSRCYVLEINARPSASMQLYNGGLFSAHIASCLSGHLEKTPVLEEYRAYQIVFAGTDIIINENIQWPLWLLDRPQEGSFIHTGRPICSIIAHGKNEQHVLDELQLRQRIVNQLLQ